MNKLAYLLLAVSASAFLAACGNKSDSKAPAQPIASCSDEMIQAHDAVFAEWRSGRKDNVEKTVQACTQARTVFNGASCRAVHFKTGESAHIPTEHFVKQCALAEKAHRAQQSGGGDKDENVGGALPLRVRNAAVLNEILRVENRDPKYIQNGVIKALSQLNKNEAYCYFQELEPGVRFQQDETLRFKEQSIRNVSGRLSATSHDGRMRIVCLKMRSYSPWSKMDLQATFGPALHVR